MSEGLWTCLGDFEAFRLSSEIYKNSRSFWTRPVDFSGPAQTLVKRLTAYFSEFWSSGIIGVKTAPTEINSLSGLEKIKNRDPGRKVGLMFSFIILLCQYFLTFKKNSFVL